MQAGLKEVLQFEKDLIRIRSQLDILARPLFYGFLAETAELLDLHQVQVIKGDKPVGILHHKSFNNDVSVDFVRKFDETGIQYLEALSGNTLQSSSQTTGKNQKSTLSELY